MEILFKEINNLVSLLEKVDEGSETLDTVTEQKQKVLDLLPVTPDNKVHPIHTLLSCGPFKQIEIPLDVLVKLLDSGFDVHALVLGRNTHYGSLEPQSCLYAAVCNEHYDAARCLVQYGHADCNLGSKRDGEALMETPLFALCKNSNAPLDLVDMLATAQSLTSYGNDRFLPLIVALSLGDNTVALRLVQLGAPVNHGWRLPIYRYTDYLTTYPKAAARFHGVLYTSLIPSDTVEILKCVGHMLHYIRDQILEYWEDYADMFSKMLHGLFQRVMPYDQMHLSIDPNCMAFLINNQRLPDKLSFPSESAFWWSVLLVNLGWNFASVPQPTGELQVDKIWNKYRSTVRSLQNLCIQSTRKCMRDFSDESFMSLPVLKKLQELLMHKNVAELALNAMISLRKNQRR